MSRKSETRKQTVTGIKSTLPSNQSTFQSKPSKGGPVKAQAGIPRQASGKEKGGQQSATGGGGPIRRFLSSVRNVLSRGKGATASTPLTEPGTSRGVDQSGGQTASRAVRRQSDIPMDILADTYTPSGTSSKAGFRSDGSDHQQDQEFATGVADERWNDEDRYTNKSGDPRIGTRGRTYEPGESRDESRSR
jgi:hypothetical protein